jgi:hypothetical protein
MAFTTDDVYNILAEKVIATLAADAKLGSGGALVVATWEQGFRENAASFNDNELPAVSVQVGPVGEELVEHKSGWHSKEFAASILATTAGKFNTAGTYATPDAAEVEALQYAARIERVLWQQNDYSKQLTAAPDATEGGITKSLKIVGVTTEAGAGEVEGTNILRGYVFVLFAFTINFTPVLD